MLAAAYSSAFFCLYAAKDLPWSLQSLSVHADRATHRFVYPVTDSGKKPLRTTTHSHRQNLMSFFGIRRSRTSSS